MTDLSLHTLTDQRVSFDLIKYQNVKTINPDNLITVINRTVPGCYNASVNSCVPDTWMFIETMASNLTHAE